MEFEMTVKKSSLAKGMKMNKKLNHNVMNKKISPELWSSVARDKFYLNFTNSISQIAASNNCYKWEQMTLHAYINEQNLTCFTGKREQRLSIRMFLLLAPAASRCPVWPYLKRQVPAMKHFKTNVQLRKVPFYRNLGESKYGGEGLDI